MPVIREDRPAYRVLATAGFYGPDDHLYPEGAMLYYDGVPNMEFEPLNGAAKKSLEAYIDNLDRLGREAAEKAGRHYSGLPRTLDEAIHLASEDARRPQLVKDGPGRPIMGARNDAQKQKVEAIVDQAEKPEDGRKGRRGGLSIQSVAASNLIDASKGAGMAGKWIKGATQNRGALHRTLGVPQGEKIPAKKLEAAKHSDNPTIRKEAALAETLKGFKHSRARKALYGKGD